MTEFRRFDLGYLPNLPENVYVVALAAHLVSGTPTAFSLEDINAAFTRNKIKAIDGIDGHFLKNGNNPPFLEALNKIADSNGLDPFLDGGLVALKDIRFWQIYGPQSQTWKYAFKPDSSLLVAEWQTPMFKPTFEARKAPSRVNDFLFDIGVEASCVPESKWLLGRHDFFLGMETVSR